MEGGQEGVMGRGGSLQEAPRRLVGLLLEELEPGDWTYRDTQGKYTLPTVKLNTPGEFVTASHGNNESV